MPMTMPTHIHHNAQGKQQQRAKKKFTTFSVNPVQFYRVFENWNRHKIIHIIYWIIVIIKNERAFHIGEKMRQREREGGKNACIEHIRQRDRARWNELTGQKAVKIAKNSHKKCVEFSYRRKGNIYNKFYTTYGIMWRFPKNFTRVSYRFNINRWYFCAVDTAVVVDCCCYCCAIALCFHF